MIESLKICCIYGRVCATEIDMVGKNLLKRLLGNVFIHSSYFALVSLSARAHVSYMSVVMCDRVFWQRELRSKGVVVSSRERQVQGQLYIHKLYCPCARGQGD